MRRVFSLLTILFIGALRFSYAQTSPDEIARKASHMSYYQGKDGTSSVTMTVTDAQGRTRQRQMAILRLNIQDNAEQKYYVYFHKPNDVKGMSYVVWKHEGKDDDRWLYLPAMDLVRRVAASDKRSSFAGTNFLYEDVSGRSVGLDTHEIIKEDGAMYQLKNAPKDSGQVEFAYYYVWVDKSNYIPMKAEYYNKEGKLYRTIEVLEVKEIQGYPTIAKMKASDLNANAHTLAEFSDVKYDVNLTNDIFTERYLRKAPLQWIKE
jgi:outer membrane lipoprotein-sorting protein